jgi:hypothetical protein
MTGSCRSCNHTPERPAVLQVNNLLILQAYAAGIIIAIFIDSSIFEFYSYRETVRKEIGLR